MNYLMHIMSRRIFGDKKEKITKGYKNCIIEKAANFNL
jgi:hypothetical protein